MKVLVAQSCPTLCNAMDCGPPGSSVPGILQARILEWVPCPPLGDLPDSGTEPGPPALQTDFFPDLIKSWEIQANFFSYVLFLFGLFVVVSLNSYTLIYNPFRVIICILCEGRFRINFVAHDCPIVPASFVIKIIFIPLN